MDRSMTQQERDECARWLTSSSLSTHEPNDEMLISFKLAKRLGYPPTRVVRAAHRQKGPGALPELGEAAVGADGDIESWMDGRVRRLRFIPQPAR